MCSYAATSVLYVYMHNHVRHITKKDMTMAQNFKTIMNEWNKIAVAGEKLAMRVHRNAMATLLHYEAHDRDTSLMTQAIELLKGKGFHRRALIQWFEKHGRVIQQTDGTFKVKAGKANLDIDKADTSPYYEDDDAMGKTGKDAKSFAFYGRLKSLLKQAGEMEAEYATTPDHFKTAPTVADAADRAVLQGMIDRWEVSKDIGKPQPKADRALFSGNHGATEVPKVVNG